MCLCPLDYVVAAFQVPFCKHKSLAHRQYYKYPGGQNLLLALPGRDELHVYYEQRLKSKDHMHYFATRNGFDSTNTETYYL